MDIITVGRRKFDDKNDKSRNFVLLVKCDFACENEIELGKYHNLK